MSIFGRIFGGSSTNNPDRGTDMNQQLIRMQRNIRDEFMNELRSEVQNDENFEDQISNASSLQDIRRLIDAYGKRHSRLEDAHGNIEDKTSMLDNKLQDALDQGLETQAVHAVRTNVNVLENTETEVEEELSDIDTKLGKLDEAVRDRKIDLEGAQGKLQEIFDLEETFIGKVETQMEDEWMDQYS